MYKKEDKIIESIHKLATGDEKVDFNALDAFFADESTGGKLLAQRISNTARREAIEERIREKDYKKGYNRLYDELSKQTKQSKLNKRLKRASVAVAGVAAVFVAMFFLFQQEGGDATQAIDTTLAENKSMDVTVPTLITEEGVYRLDGNLSDIKHAQGYTLVKADSKLAYAEEVDNLEESEDVSKQTFNTLKVPPLYTYSLKLSDATEISINAGTVLRYPTVLSGDKRVVELDGEAFFKVAKSTVPFIVRCKGVDIQVYGTEFYVSNAGEYVEAVLVEGSVGVSSEGQEECMMKPNNLLTYDESEGLINLRDSVDTSNYLAWMHNTFLYNEQEFGRVIADLENWYGIKINYPAEMTHLPFTANIKKYNEINELMNFLEVIVGKTIIREERRTYSLN